MEHHRYFIIYKPFGILSQFSAEGGKEGLGSLFEFPKEVYPVGRLDADSEGLLILTNDKSLNSRLLHPQQKHWRTYFVQVDGAITSEALKKLEQGVTIKINKKEYHTRPSVASLLSSEPMLPERNPPIRFRKEIPTSWLSLSLQEGKNRQVRRMTAAVGFPTLRLVRVRIEALSIDGMLSGEVKELNREELFMQLKMQPEEKRKNSFRAGKRK
ncbi:pseudouridine synthase [Nafulsella turpanensis]|uniref:pseudouridine synthase n=1 Tax=Nafulsella turpanensis TaxID=1265690 RepID=UPI00034DB384|nr:pseudouridine synthase [Nafulsella turpanensis]